MSDIPLSDTGLPPVERGEPAGYPLGVETLGLLSHMAATMLPGLVREALEPLSETEAVALAVRMAVGIANELRTYQLLDNKAVKMEPKNPDV